jgi:signal transduction histidine kinase
LRALLDEVVAELNLNQLHDKIAVSSEIPAELYVWSDRELIREAFHNIMNNAVKAMPVGGMLNINAHTRSERNLVRIIFEDNGKGMSQSEIEAAKLGFVSTQTHTGLGVLVSILLSRATGGDLEIESEIGSGTRVTVTLPLSPVEDSS